MQRHPAEFCDHFVRPAAAQAGATVELSNSNPQLEDFVTLGTAQLLISFSRLADRAFLHHNDRRRWYEFVSAAYRERATLTPDMLERWCTNSRRAAIVMAGDVLSTEQLAAIIHNYTHVLLGLDPNREGPSLCFTHKWATTRVMPRRHPSPHPGKQQLKDWFIFEAFLELTAQLRKGGLSEMILL